jgi:hypothetical protein
LNSIDNNISLGNFGNGGLGDCLYLTSVFRYKRGKIILHNDEQSKQVSRVFDYIAEVEFSNNPPERPDKDCKLPVHRAEKILKSMGIESRICVPYVVLTKEEKEWSKNFLKDYNNPIIIVNDNSGTWDSTNTRAHYVRPPVALMQEMCNFLYKNGYTPLQFGRKEINRFTPLKNAIHIRGLDIRELAACYHSISKIVSGDTGDYHLMLGVGGKASVFHPPHSEQMGYLFEDLHYKPENFENGVSRVDYIDYTTIKP